MSSVRTVITIPDQMHARAKQRAAELGISFAEFVRRLFEKELEATAHQGDIETICAMVSGTPFDMAQDGHEITSAAVNRLNRTGSN